MRSITRSNSLRLAILLWFVGWLVVFMPGHTRGIVKLPGTDAAVASSCCEPKPCCEVTTSGCCDLGTSDENAPPQPTDPAQHCAICFLKAHLTDPPPITLYTPYLGVLDELSYAAYDSVFEELAAPTRSRGRAPPSV